MEEIGLSTFDGEKKSETSGKSKINLPQYVIVNWHWNIIRNTFSFVLFSAILGAFSASAILIAHLPRRCDPSTEWWQGKIFYEIFPTSFHDSDNNGVHNLNGVILKLDYLSNKLNVDAVHLNSIFEASDYPSSYLDIINCTKVDPLLGDMKTFQELVTSITKRNMSLVLDIHVDRLPGISGASVLSEEASLIVEDTMKFWLHRGVHGFFLKGLDKFNHQKDLGEKISHWKKMITRFSSGFTKARILITSSDFLVGYTHNHPEAADLHNKFDLVQHHLNREQISTVADQIKQGLHWNDGMEAPWVLWSLASIDTPQPAHSVLPGK